MRLQFDLHHKILDRFFFYIGWVCICAVTFHCSSESQNSDANIAKDSVINGGQDQNIIGDAHYDSDGIVEKKLDALSVDAPAGCVHPKAVKNCTNGWCTILAGCYKMGSPNAEPCRDTDEKSHEVTLTHTFEISQTEVTQDEFLARMTYNPSYFAACGGDCPVETLNWHEAVAYCNALSDKAGLEKCYTCKTVNKVMECNNATAYTGEKIYSCPGYRLPTEAEWEYAYRADIQEAYYSGANDAGHCDTCSTKDANADSIAWACFNSTVSYTGCEDLSKVGGAKCAGTHKVGKKQANAWGLYDMSGNVWEWCHDWYKNDLGISGVTNPTGAATGSFRLTRGGAWNSKPKTLRAAHRQNPEFYPFYRNYDLGFRCVKSVLASR